MLNVGRRRSFAVLALVLVAALAVTACQPERPSAGRNTPVRRVLIVGDSISWGVFGTTPRVNEYVVPMLKDRNVSTWILGFPGDNLYEPWPGQKRWVDDVRQWIAAWDPDMVIVQSSAFPGGTDPAKQQAYLAAARELFSVAGSRGAHVYRVKHSMPPEAHVRNEHMIAEYIQGVAAGDTISAIPLDWWMNNCNGPFTPDGWHLSANGQRCHAQAITAAVDQLRGVVG